MFSSAFGHAGVVAIVAVVGLLAGNILESDSLAGLPGGAATLGAAVAATPLALRARRVGRRRAIRIGYLLGATGAVSAFIAGQTGAFWPLVAAMALLGLARTSNLQSRFAAADLATEETRARSISLVVWVATIGAVVGPAGALWANRVGIDFGLAEWTAPLLVGAAAFLISGVIVGSRLKPDPLDLAGGMETDTESSGPFDGLGRTMSAIWGNRRARLAIIAMAVSQMAMVAVMTMTPLHMRDHGHADLSTLVISVHVLGMYGLSPLVGRWADRFGRLPMLILGATVLATGTVISVGAGYVPSLMFAGLFLLGLGWSFALIAGSALLTESLPVSERVGAQGFADLAMSALGATAAIGSGFVKATVGFHWLANFATLSAIAIIAAAVMVARHRPATQEIG